MPPDPPIEPFLFLNQLQISSTEKKKIRFKKNMEFMLPPPPPPPP